MQTPTLGLIPLLIVGCAASAVSPPPLRTSPVPTVDGESGIRGRLDEHADGIAFLAFDDARVYRLDGNAPTLVQDRDFDDVAESFDIERLRVLDDDTVVVQRSRVERDGVFGRALVIYEPDAEPRTEWFARSRELTFDARTLDDLWIYRDLQPEPAQLCRRSAGMEICYGAPPSRTGYLPELYVGRDGWPYLLVDRVLLRFVDGSFSAPIAGLDRPRTLHRRGELDIVRTAWRETYALVDGAAVLLTEVDGAEVYGDGGQIVVQEGALGGSGGGPDSVSGFVAGEGGGGALYWEETVWTLLDGLTSDGIEIGHETCDWRDGSGIGEGCFRTRGELLVQNGTMWAFGRPARSLDLP